MAGGERSLERVDPTFREHFNAFRQAALDRHGLRIQVLEGFRTRAEQEYFYRLYLAGRGNLAARPGTSRHETGLAIDISPDVGQAPVLRPLLAEYGLCLPVRPPYASQLELWHVEPAWTRPTWDPLRRPYQPIPGARPAPVPPSPAEEDVMATLDEVRQVVAEVLEGQLAALGIGTAVVVDGAADQVAGEVQTRARNTLGAGSQVRLVDGTIWILWPAGTDASLARVVMRDPGAVRALVTARQVQPVVLQEVAADGEPWPAVGPAVMSWLRRLPERPQEWLLP